MAGKAFVLALVATLFGSLPTATAGSQEAPEVTDPAGDLRYQGAPVPAGFDWADLRRAWFESGSNETLTLTIEVVGATGPPPRGEVGVTFQVGGQYWISGWTVFPPLYSGGFLSKSDKNGDVPSGVSPSNAAATWTRDRIVVQIPRAAIDPQGDMAGIAEPYGWSESHATQGRMYRLDETAVGSAFNWTAAPPSDAATPVSTSASRATSGASSLALLGILGIVAAVCRIRRS